MSEVNTNLPSREDLKQIANAYRITVELLESAHFPGNKAEEVYTAIKFNTRNLEAVESQLQHVKEDA